MVFINTTLGLIIGMAITSDIKGKLLIVLSTLFVIYLLNYEKGDFEIEE